MDDDIKARSHAGEAMSTEELARKAGFLVCDAGIYRDRQEGPFTLKPELERFAALVGADERAKTLEEAAKVCDGKERRKWEILTVGGKLEGFGPLDCAHAIRALK